MFYGSLGSQNPVSTKERKEAYLDADCHASSGASYAFSSSRSIGSGTFHSSMSHALDDSSDNPDDEARWPLVAVVHSAVHHLWSHPDER